MTGFHVNYIFKNRDDEIYMNSADIALRGNKSSKRREAGSDYAVHAFFAGVYY